MTDQSTVCRVLVVDDNVDLATATAILLKFNGYTVTTAFNGRDAIEQACTFRPGIVILDIGLPDRNGYEVARTLRKELGLVDAVIVVASAWDLDKEQPHDLFEVIDYYVTKPINVSRLLQWLRSQRRPQSEDG